MKNSLVAPASSSTVEKQQLIEELLDVLTKPELSKDAKIQYVGVLFDELDFKLYQPLRSIDICHDEILERLYAGEHFSKERIEQDMEMFDSAYALMKQAFNGRNRVTTEGDSKERYFTHLQAVMEIVLKELPGANMDRIVIALLHDVLEDIPGYSYDTLCTIYGEYIANAVLYLSKKDRRDYLSDQEKLAYDVADEEDKNILKYKSKDRRNEEYFGHLSDLNDDCLAVKFADRVHNLRTMENFSIGKVRRKITETEKYFLPVAKEKMPDAYVLLVQELKRLRAFAYPNSN